jgi:hypothetical protein
MMPVPDISITVKGSNSLVLYYSYTAYIPNKALTHIEGELYKIY